MWERTRKPLRRCKCGFSPCLGAGTPLLAPAPHSGGAEAQARRGRQGAAGARRRARGRGGWGKAGGPPPPPGRAARVPQAAGEGFWLRYTENLRKKIKKLTEKMYFIKPNYFVPLTPAWQGFILRREANIRSRIPGQVGKNSSQGSQTAWAALNFIKHSDTEGGIKKKGQQMGSPFPKYVLFILRK